ncbi:MAG: fatty acid--CoA ligase family protein, partial [Pseudomonadota bacterium]
ENQLAALTFNQHDRHLLPTPLYFGGGRAFAISHLFIGATLILHPPPYEPADLAQAVETHRADTTFLVPTLIRRLLQLPDAALAPMRRLRVLVSSGAPLHPPEREAVATRLTPGFMEYFASTEGGGVAILPPGAWRGHPNSVGRAALGVEVEVVGEDRRPLPPGEEGLVRYRGASVATSFFNDPEKSAEAFRDGWFHPGDIGRLDAEGYLTLLGRASQKIIRGGVNLHPAEIERALEGLPEIEEAAVFGIPHPELGEEVRAVVVAGADTDAARVRAALGGRLAPYKIPRDIVFAEALPRNAAGKVALREVKARWGDVEASAQP